MFANVNSVRLHYEGEGVPAIVPSGAPVRRRRSLWQNTAAP
jgi:hypothetical protein